MFIYNQHIQHKNTDFGWVLNTQNNAFGEFLLKKLNLVGWIKKGGGVMVGRPILKELN